MTQIPGLSQRQLEQRRGLQQKGLALPTAQSPSPTNHSLFPPVGNSQSETTKETVNTYSVDQKQEQDRIREDSPLGEADPTQSSLTKERRKDLLGAAQVVFPARRKLYSLDGFGRRSEIETGHMSATAYQALVEAFQSPIRFDGPPQTSEPAVANEPMRVPAGCKLGPATGLQLPEWWELPSAEATREEMQGMIQRNLERAGREGRGVFRRFSGGVR